MALVSQVARQHKHDIIALVLSSNVTTPPVVLDVVHNEFSWGGEGHTHTCVHINTHTHTHTQSSHVQQEYISLDSPCGKKVHLLMLPPSLPISPPMKRSTPG